MAAEELAVADDALALGADVDEDLVLVDADDRAFDDVAVLEALDVGVLLGEQLLHRRRLGAEVARGRGRSGSSASRPRRPRRSARRVGGRRRGVGSARRRSLGSASRLRRGAARPRRPRLGGRGVGRRCCVGSGAAASGASAAGAAASAAGAARPSRPRRRARLGGLGLGGRRVGSVGSASAVSASAVGVAASARRLGGRSASAVVPSRARRRGLGRSVVASVSAVAGSAGSSATAIAARVGLRTPGVAEALASAAAWSRPAALRSMDRSSPVVDSPPENHERPERRSGRVRGSDRVWSVVIVAPRSAPSCSMWPESRSSAVLPLGPGESSTGVPSHSRLQSRAVPELPDLTVVAEAFHAALAGRPMTAAEAPGPLAVRGTPAELAALVGQRVDAASARRGKFLMLDLDRDRVVVNPMLTGRFQLAAPGAKLPTKTAVVLGFGRAGAPRGSSRAAWTAGATWLPADDATPEVRYRDPTQMGKVYLLPAGVERAVPGLGADEIGPGRRRPGADPRGLARADPAAPGRAQEPAPQPGVRRRHRQRLQRRDPPRGAAAAVPQALDARAGGGRRAVRGDARDPRDARSRSCASGSRRRSRRRSATSSRSTCKGGQPCPRCGTRITEVKAGGFVTSYCRGCQR